MQKSLSKKSQLPDSFGIRKLALHLCGWLIYLALFSVVQHLRGFLFCTLGNKVENSPERCQNKLLPLFFLHNEDNVPKENLLDGLSLFVLHNRIANSKSKAESCLENFNNAPHYPLCGYAPKRMLLLGCGNSRGCSAAEAFPVCPNRQIADIDER